MDAIGWIISIAVVLLVIQHFKIKKIRNLAEKRAQILRQLYITGKAEPQDLLEAELELDPALLNISYQAAPQPPAVSGSQPDTAPTRIEPIAAAESAEPSAEAVIAAAEPSAEPSAEPVKAPAFPPEETILPAFSSETAAEPVTVPAFASPAAAEGAFPQPAHKSDSPAPQVSGEPSEPVIHFSAISVMLSVGVVLVIVAGLLFVRSMWSELSGFGKLAILGAGSALFFGTSALAHRKLSLERTGMAFFTLGAAYLPISVWAAGYLRLLGDGLSGPDNKWLIALSFLIFTGIAAFAVKIYRQKSWAIGVLGGISLAYFNLVRGITEGLDHPLQWAILFFAVYAALIAHLAHRLLDILPPAYAAVIEPFAGILVAAASLPFFGLTDKTDFFVPAAFAALILASAYLAPAICDRLLQYTAIPTAVMTLLGFFLMLLPLWQQSYLDFCAYAALAVTLAAIIFCLLTARDLVPEDTRIGFRYGTYALTAISVPVHLFISHNGWYVALATAALTLSLVLLVKSTPGKQICAAAAGIGWLFCGDAVSWSHRFFAMNPAESYLLAGGCFLAGFAAFYWKKRIRNLPANLLFTCSAAVSADIVLLRGTLPLWQSLSAFGIAAAAAGICYVLAQHPRTREPWYAVYACLTPGMLFGALFFAWTADALSLTQGSYSLIAGTLAMLCFVLFFRAKRLRNPLTDILFPMLAASMAFRVLSMRSAANWQDALALLLICTAAGCFCFMALHKETASPFHTVYGYLMAAVFGLGTAGMMLGGCFGLAEETILLIGSALAMLCFVLFFRTKHLRSVHANVIFPMLSAFSSMSMFWALRKDVWQNAAAFVFILGAAALLYAMARSKHSAKPAYFLYCGMMSAVLICAVFTVWDCTLGDFHDYTYALILSAVCVICCAAFRSQKRLRNHPADIIFPCIAVLSAAFAMMQFHIPPLGITIALVIFGAAITFYWLLACENDSCTPLQHFYAALVPLILCSAAHIACAAVTAVSESVILLCWTLISLVLAFTAVFTVRSQFHTVRQTMFGLTAVPPMLLALFSSSLLDQPLVIIQPLICAAAAAAIWQIFAGRSIRFVPTAGFAASLLLVMNTTGYAVSHYVYRDAMNFTVAMVPAIWLILLGGAAFFVQRDMLDFNGCKAIPAPVQIYLTACAGLFSLALLSLGKSEWNSFYFIYTLGICLLAWFTSKREQLTLPVLTAIAALFSAEALRQHTDNGSGLYLAGMILIMSILTVLLPYLGIVSREDGIPHNRRSYVLTVFGGIMPFWLLLTADDHTGDQTSWIIFFMLVMLAGYILHFTFIMQDSIRRKHLFALAAGICTIALWLTPMIDTAGTYWEGKLHLLPLIAFGAVIRLLYGAETGSAFLFGIGIYALLRLAGCAFRTESAEDLLTLIGTALAIFIVSFYIKQKKWFLLGGISLLFTAVYMDIKLTNTLHWWVYLLLAGIVLIVIAATNETLKSRGDSLRERAGRFWEDWTW